MNIFEAGAFCEMMKTFCKEAHDNSVAHGFWDEGERFLRFGGMGEEFDVKTKPWNFAEKIALIHSEISEALEKHRKGDGPDEHCPELSGIAIEFADALIRIADLCGKMNIDLGQAIVAKMAYNKSRPIKHGKAY